jgi:hypothetical protein
MKKSHRDWVKKENAVDTFIELYEPTNWTFKIAFSPYMYKRMHEEIKSYSNKVKPSDFILNYKK